MKKLKHLRTITLLITALTAAFAWANPISVNQAQSVASRILSGKTLERVSLQRAHQAPGQNAAYYVFNAKANQGYVIVAGDDALPPVLGYSDKGAIDPNDIPEALQQLLDYYAECTASAPNRPAKLIARNAIAPLTTSIWGQSEPFNIYLPFTRTTTNDDGTPRAWHGKVGCVATAMAQLLYYYKWPDANELPIPEYTTKTNGYHMPELPVTTFEWDLMKDSYNTTDSLNESGQAAAKLSLYCAQALEMDFQKSTSSASTSRITSLLVQYFKYAATARYVQRANYNTQSWEDLLYAELQAQRPVIYRGDKNPGGHAFLVDGCDNTGLFHVNWGWNSLSDGYFVLSDLNPDAQGIGGAEGECGYIFGQAMITGVKPNDWSMAPTNVRFYTMIINSFTGTRTSSNGNFNINVSGRFHNNTSEEEVFDYGWGLFQGNQLLSTVGEIKSRTNPLAPNYYLNNTSSLDFGAGLADGTYYLHPIWSELYENDWHVCEGGMVNYIEVTINGNNCTYEEYGASATPQYQANELTFVGTMHAGRQVTATASITNLGNTVGDMIYIMDNGTKANVSLTDLQKGETGDVVFYITPATAGTHTITLSLKEDGSNPLITRELNIEAMPAASLTMSNKILYVTDAVNKIITSYTYSVETTVTNTGANAYNEDIVLRLYRVSNGTSGTVVQDVAMPLQLEPGETKVVRFDCDNVVSGEKYFCWVYYFSAGEKIKCKGTSSHTLIFPTEPTTVYLIGDAPLGGWNPETPIQMTEEEGIYTYTANMEEAKDVYFVFTEGIGSWEEINGHRYGPTEANQDVVVGEEMTTQLSTNDQAAYKLAAEVGEYTFTFDLANLKFKVEKIGSPGIPGDSNGDGQIDITDVNAVINMMLGKVAMDPICDMDGSGNIDISDVNAIINKMLGK